MGVREGWTDEHRASEFGRLFMTGQITRAEYDDGIAYAIKILDYLKTIEAPAPYGGISSEFSDKMCMDRKIAMSEARERLNRAGKRAARVVDRIAVYGEGLGPDDLPLLRAGLKALGGK